MDFCNLQGAFLGIVYIILYYKYLYYQDNKIKFYIIVFCLIISSAIIIVVEYFLIFYKYYIRNLIEIDHFIEIINWIGVIFNIGEYLPIGFDFFFLIKNKISEKNTLLGAYVGIINTILWLIWSIIKTFTTTKDEQNNGKKYHSFVANIIGLLLCLSQLGLYYIYKKDEEKDNDNDKEKPLDEKGIDNDSSTGNNLITSGESEHSEEKKIEDEFI
jgi:glucan phosphoethanolaminetransferase (alkaline phosphatase superfamily)